MLQIFWIIEGFSTNFLALWDNHNRQTRDDTIIRTILITEYSETQTGSLAMILGDVRQKKLTESSYPYYPKNFEQRIFLKHRSVRPRWFLEIWDKKNSTNLWYPYYPEKFWCQNNSETQKGHPRCFAIILDKQFPTEKRDTPFLSVTFFCTRNFLKPKSVPPRSFLVLWD